MVGQLELAGLGQGAVEDSDPILLMTELVEQIDRFNAVWPQYVERAVVFPYSFYQDGLVPNRIEVDRVEGAEAVELCVLAYRAFARQRVQHPGSVFRLPGYVQLDRLLLDEIDTINSMKTQLQNAIKARYPAYRARNAFCRKHFQGRVMLQVYRQLCTARAPIQSVRFSWSPSTSATRKLDKQDVLNTLIKRLESGADPIDSNRYKALAMAIEKTRKLGKRMEVVQQRRHSPYPVATLFHTHGRHAIKTMIPLSLPVFIGSGVGKLPVEFGDLHSFDGSVRKRQRSDQKTTEMLFAPANLYIRCR